MAQKGSLNLKSESLLEMYNTIKKFEATFQSALYEQYKAAYKISLTNYMRGDAADAFKTYFSQGTINMIQGLLDISSEMTMIIQFITEAFYQFESSGTGKIKELRLDDIENELLKKKNVYDSMDSELAQVLNLASQYITTTSLEYEEVVGSYTDVSNKIRQIREEMYAIDDEVLVAAQELLGRINDLSNLVSQTMGLCYKDGNFIPKNAKDISSKSWYSRQSNATLVLMLAEDPFNYESGAGSISENQWAAGLCSDVYVYAGYSFLSGSYESGSENGTVFAKAKGAVLSVNGYAQLTDYVKAQGEAKLIYGEVDAKAGASEEYFGAHIKVEAGVLEINGSVIVGNDDFNGYIKGDAKVLCADGKAAFEFEEDGQFAIGVDASATLASASGSAGLSFFKYKVEDGTATAQQTDNLFRLHVKGGATVGAGFAAYAENKTAIETDIVNVNALSMKLEVGLGLDLDVSITVPTIYIKYPW